MIYSVGHTALDYVFQLGEFPPNHSSRPIHSFTRLYGGGAANHAFIAARLGAKASLVSPLGSDFKSSGYEAHLSKAGVSLSKSRRFSSEPMPRAYIFNDRAMHQRTMFYWGASKFFPEMKAPRLNKNSIIHIAAGDPVFNRRLAEKYSSLSFDPARDIVRYTGKDLKRIMASTKFLYCNQHELREIEKKTGQRRKEFASEMTIVSHGAKGSEIFVGSHHIKIPVFKTRAADPTGAGDAYMAGFLTAYEKGHSIADCGLAGSCVASFIVEKQGPQAGAPSWGKMRRRMK